MIIARPPVIVASELVQAALMPAGSDGEHQARHACKKQGFHRASFFRTHRKMRDVCATRELCATPLNQRAIDSGYRLIDALPRYWQGLGRLTGAKLVLMAPVSESPFQSSGCSSLSHVQSNQPLKP